jgi:cell division protein FtsW (lipid II flippase)
MIKRNETLPQKGKPDKSILIFAALMTFFGIIMIFNASAYVASEEF